MSTRLDHVVLWVEDVERAIRFYTEVVGFEGVRVEAFRAGEAPFPSVRVSPDTILDLMPRAAAPMVDSMAGADASAGHPVNHVCFAFDRDTYRSLVDRLEKRNVGLSPRMTRSFGARGLAPEAVYFRDPDGNVLEARTYEE